VQPTQSGRSGREKLHDVSLALAKAGADGVVITQPDSIAWLFNIRGSDVSYTPVVLAYAIIHRDGPGELFVDASKVPEDVAAHLNGLLKLEAFGIRRRVGRPWTLETHTDRPNPGPNASGISSKAAAPPSPTAAIPAPCPRRARMPPNRRVRAPPTAVMAWP
jgi:hypothetical protein